MEDQKKEEDDTILSPDGEVRELFRERRAQMEIKKKKEDDAKKAEQAAKALERKKVLEKADPEATAALKHIAMQKKMQEAAREDRVRVLRRIEDDQAERRIKATMRKERARDMNGSDQSGTTAPESLLQPPTRDGVDCAIQVKLFDGTTIKSRFPSHNTLREHVRPWIAGQQAVGDAPYTFKKFLGPRLSRELTMAEEDKSLKLIGLMPSATLILVPAPNYSTAYEGGMGRSWFSASSLAWLPYRLLASGFGLATGPLRWLLGNIQTTASPDRPRTPKTTFGTSLDGQVPSENQQFYNGNSLNFEPRWIDEDQE